MTDIAILHYPAPGVPPKGVWWWDGSSQLQKFYTDDDMRPIGEARMGIAQYRADSVDVEDFFSRLSSSTPRPDFWSGVIRLGDMTAPEYLTYEARMYLGRSKSSK